MLILFIICELVAMIIGILIGVLFTSIYYLRIINKFRKYLEEIVDEMNGIRVDLQDELTGGEDYRDRDFL